jgi:hypothetical protein
MRPALPLGLNLLLTLSLSLSLGATLLAHPAGACPTIATGTTSQLSFDTAQVAITHVDGRTTFSVSINPLGEPQDFALVMPVPTLLRESDIRTLDSAIFAELDGYTAPRHVADAGCGYVGYVPCNDGSMSGSDGSGEGEGEGEGEAFEEEGGVDVEAHYLIGGYSISILSAEESGSLSLWLDTNGYHLPEGAEERLAEYIEAGSYFMVAKVDDSAATADGSPLSPLQVAYDADIYAIPIRLAALSAIEDQDMVIYALSDAEQGQVGIATYEQIEVPEVCLWGGDGERDFAAYYDDLFEQQHAAVGGAAWAVEFSDLAGNCSPCTAYNPFFDRKVMKELGFSDHADDGGQEWPWITRIHMRYSRETADVDLMLYNSGIQSADALTYADDVLWNRACVDHYCDGTPAEAPPATVYEDCGEEGGGSEATDTDADGVLGGGGRGCSTGSASDERTSRLGLGLVLSGLAYIVTVSATSLKAAMRSKLM